MLVGFIVNKGGGGSLNFLAPSVPYHSLARGTRMTFFPTAPVLLLDLVCLATKKEVTDNEQYKETEVSSKGPYESQTQLVLVRNEICSFLTAAPRPSLGKNRAVWWRSSGVFNV